MQDKKTLDFIAKAIKKHGEKYNYSRVNYVRSRDNVEILCEKHGIFSQTPNDHLRGRGCKHCGEEKRREKRKTPLDEFVRKAKLVHGDRWDYSDARRNDDGKMIIRCRIHGEFPQSGSKHLSGQGCPKCAPNAQLNNQTFIDKAKQLHGDRYDYSLVDFQRWDLPVEITCSVHGIFPQSPNSHLQGSGCYKCGRDESASKQRLSKEDFIDRANAVHGGKYDYSEVGDFKNNKDNIVIICPKHGPFKQSISSHINNGSGCNECGREKTASSQTQSLNDFLTRAQKIHGDAYDYSNVKYEGIFTPVEIICKVHGPFPQIPANHYAGNGCPECGNQSIGAQKRKSFETFVKEANARHGNKYSYTNAKYINGKTPIEIICSIHGRFMQRPSKHLAGDGCDLCGRERTAEARTKSQEQFIEEAQLVHEGEYDYSQTVYNGAREKLTIICRKHGTFEQTASEHLMGSGCQACGREIHDSRGARKINEILNTSGLNFVREAKFETCRDQLPLPFDFYIPEYSILIEYDGEQHFKPIPQFGGQLAYEGQVRRDEIKNKWARSNGFLLIRIRFDEDVVEATNDIIQKISIGDILPRV